jgi:large subunit ribosomal protein L18
MRKSKKTQRRNKRKKRIRAKVFGKKTHPRLSVYRSNKYIYAQLIDDEKGSTLIAVNEKDLKIDKGKKYSKSQKAELVGELLARKARRKRITKVVFDRGGYRYHGRVKAVAEAARKGGLKF